MGGATVQDKTGNFQEAKEKRFCVPEGLASSAMELTIKMKMGADIAVYPQDRDLPAVWYPTPRHGGVCWSWAYSFGGCMPIRPRKYRAGYPDLANPAFIQVGNSGSMHRF